ncbi:MAG: LamG-like jellyroll fold domain-containing protein [Bacteroidota bacterium]
MTKATVRSLVSCLVILLLAAWPVVSAAQTPADVPGVEVPGIAGTGTSGEGVLPSSGGRPGGMEEYGSYSVNGALGGLGATGGYVAVPHNSIFRQNFDGSVEAWIYPTATTSSAPCIVGMGAATSVGFLFGVQWSSTKLYFRIGNGVSINTDGISIPLDTWSHVAAVWTGGPSAFQIQFYVNGTASGAPVSNPGTWNLAEDSLTIGTIEAPFGGKIFYGSIDEVRFWTTARTQTELRESRWVGVGDGGAANANNALTASSAYTGLAASWTFNTGGLAWDDLGGNHGSYRNGAGAWASGQGLPIPYNLALYLPGSTGDYVSVQDNAIFDQTSSGSIEAWVKPMVSGLNTIFQKGTSFSTTTLAFYVTSGNKVGINIGAHNYISSGPAVIPMEVWTHLAATWSGGPNFTVRLYVNGKLDDTQTHNLAMPVSADTAWIGRYYTTTGNFEGYLDEVRLWGDLRSQAEIQRYMFVSGRTLTSDANLEGLWNFDGNLNNFSSNTGLNGSFNTTSGVNNCRLSGNVNENDGWSHITVINRDDSPNSFPAGFRLSTPFKVIPDNNTAGVSDTILYPIPTGLSTVEAFLSIQHTYMGDLIVTLTAPNGQTRDLLNRHGSSRNNVLSFFGDGWGADPASPTYRAPWAYVRPIEAFATFGGSPANGQWILTLSDRAGGDEGWLQGWGLRFNNITGVEPVSGGLPGEFALDQNYPNPFNPETRIEFSLPEQSTVTLQVFNLLGQRVAVLADNEQQEAGRFGVTWNPASALPGGLGSGVYFYRLDAKGASGRVFASTKKMVLLK